MWLTLFKVGNLKSIQLSFMLRKTYIRDIPIMMVYFAIKIKFSGNIIIKHFILELQKTGTF